jgi:hypothetical protein
LKKLAQNKKKITTKTGDIETQDDDIKEDEKYRFEIKRPEEEL